jgi:hypothetical protein
MSEVSSTEFLPFFIHDSLSFLLLLLVQLDNLEPRVLVALP